MKGKACILAGLVASISAQQISNGCNTYLQQLDSNPTLSQCATPLLEATAAYNPVAGQNGNATVQATLATICSSTTQFCSQALLQTTLNEFFTSCAAEMGGASAVPAVQSLYDSLYMLPAFKTAVCATDADTQNSCLMQIGTGKSSAPAPSESEAPIHQEAANATEALAINATVSLTASALPSMGPANVSNAVVGVVALQQVSSSSFDLQAMAGSVLQTPSFLYQVASTAKQIARRRLLRRQEWNADGTPVSSSSSSAPAPSPSAASPNAANIIDSAIVPNTTTFTDSYLHFLFLNPDMSTEQLCTSCTQQILASYVSWEGKQPYPIGISNSGMLGVQIKLYRAVSARCGTGFAQHISVIAGQNTLQGSATGLKVGAVWTVALTMLLWLIM